MLTECVILLPARVRVGMLSREPEPDIASGAVCCGCTRRLDMYTDDLWWLGDGPSVFPLGTSGLRFAVHLARHARWGDTGGRLASSITHQSDGFRS